MSTTPIDNGIKNQTGTNDAANSDIENAQRESKSMLRGKRFRIFFPMLVLLIVATGVLLFVNRSEQDINQSVNEELSQQLEHKVKQLSKEAQSKPDDLVAREKANDANNQLVEAYLKEGKYEQAKSILSDGSEIQNLQADVWIAEARSDYATAVELCKKQIELLNNVESQTGVGQAKEINFVKAKILSLQRKIEERQ